MNNNPNIHRIDDEITFPTNSSVYSESDIASNNSKSKEQLTDLTLDFVGTIFSALKSNADDYESIMADDQLSAYDKAIAKRKLLVRDICTGAITIVGGVATICIVKKILS